MKAGSGEYKYEEGSLRPEYETLAMFGSNCGNNAVYGIGLIGAFVKYAATRKTAKERQRKTRSNAVTPLGFTSM